MAYIEKQISKKTGKPICYKWTALLGRDEHTKKQIRLTKRVELYGLTPARERDRQQKEADAWEEKERAEYEKSTKKTPEELRREKREKESITLEDFIDKHWITEHVEDGKHTPDSIAFFRSMSADIKRYFNSAYPGMKLIEMDKAKVLAFLSYLRKDAKTKKGTPYSAATIQHYFSTLRNILEYAVYIEYLTENPCKKLKASDRPRREQKEIEFLDEDQAVDFLACLESEKEAEYWKKNNGDVLFWKCMVNILITTGLRRGELVGLQWGDVDKKNMTFHIRRNVTVDTSNKGEKDPAKKIHIGELKGKEGRIAPLSKYVLGLLTEYRRAQQEKYGALLLPNSYIFCRADNPMLPLYPTEPTRLMKKFITRHKLPDMSPHDLRHTAGYLAIESGASVKDIQQLLGHKDPALTLRYYIGVKQTAAQRTVEGIEGILRPPKKEENKNA